MAHLTDMEELLSSISSPIIKDYMREAMSCYMAAAYRGTIVLSFIALFDDLLAKLGELGNVNGDAKSLFVEASKRKDDQDVYETYLINQLTSKSLISGLDASFLDTLRKLRNKAAHPSGHKPSPEEARFIFFETVTRFLSKPILSTTILVDEIIGRLKNANFFPSLLDSDMAVVTQHETASLHPEAFVQLIVKLTSCVLSTDSTVASNAGSFLIGLARQNKDSILAELRARVITAKCDDPQYAELTVQLLSANGRLFLATNSTCVNRIKAILMEKVSEVTSALPESSLAHPTQALTSIARALPSADFASTFDPELIKLFEKRAHSEFIVRLIKLRPALLSLYFPAALNRASSSQFDTANSFANALESLDKSLTTLLSDEQAFQLLTGVVRAADGGAWTSQGIANAKFASAKGLRAKALQYIDVNEAAATSYLAEQLSTEKTIDEYKAKYLLDSKA